jgi:hypothetical protein
VTDVDRPVASSYLYPNSLLRRQLNDTESEFNYIYVAFEGVSTGIHDDDNIYELASSQPHKYLKYCTSWRWLFLSGYAGPEFVQSTYRFWFTDGPDKGMYSRLNHHAAVATVRPSTICSVHRYLFRCIALCLLKSSAGKTDKGGWPHCDDYGS